MEKKYTGLTKEQIRQRLISWLEPKRTDSVETSFINSEPVRVYEYENRLFTLLRKIDQKLRRITLYTKLRPYLKTLKRKIPKVLFYRHENVLDSFKEYNNAEFLKLIYNKTLKRDPDIEGFTNYLFYLESSYPREVIYFWIASSPEAQNYYLDSKSLKYYKRFTMKFFLKKKIIKLLTPWKLLKNIFAIGEHTNRLAFVYNRSIEFEDQFKYNNLNYTKVLTEMNTLNKAVQIELSDAKNEIKRLEEEIAKESQLSNNLINELKYAKLEMDNLKQELESKHLEKKILIEKLQIDNQNLESTMNNVVTNHSLSIENINSQLELLKVIDIPDIYETEGILGFDSYLDEARKRSESILENFNHKYPEDTWYYIFESLFRGKRQEIKALQERYIPLLLKHFPDKSKHIFVDAGCGRGEFLELLKQNEIPSIGVDISHTNVDILRAEGYNVLCSDVLEYLESLEDNTISGLSAFQVIEHLKHDYVKKIIQKAAKKIIYGGCIILETYNPYCFSKMGNYYIDPTHITQHSPDSLKLILEYNGFFDVKIIFYAPVESRLRNNNLIYNYEGFAIVGYKKDGNHESSCSR